MRRWGLVGSVALGLLWGEPWAWSQQVDPDSGLSERAGARSQVIQAVERGVFFQASFGGSQVIVADDLDVGFGATVGAHLGFDLGPVANLAFGAHVITAGSTRGRSDAEVQPADLLWVTPTARVEVAVLTTDRLFVRVRGEGGYAFAQPETVGGQAFGRGGPVFGGAGVIEYYTKLRHFSIGVSAGAMAFWESVQTPGRADQRSNVVSVQITPQLKYSF